MLEGLLTGKDCAECRFCCKFNMEDISEKPFVYQETVDYVRTYINKEQKFIKEGNHYYFDLPFSYYKEWGEEIATCPMLVDKEGCVLGEHRMFDCKIWPFRIMNKEGELLIGLSCECEHVFKKSKEEIQKELEHGLAELIFKEAQKHPEMIKPYRENHRIVLYKKDWEKKEEQNILNFK